MVNNTNKTFSMMSQLLTKLENLKQEMFIMLLLTTVRHTQLPSSLTRAAYTKKKLPWKHALLAKNILVKDGGERRVRDTNWAGRPKPMVNTDGTAKGLQTILQERGINASSLKADDKKTILFNHDDLLNGKKTYFGIILPIWTWWEVIQRIRTKKWSINLCIGA